MLLRFGKRQHQKKGRICVPFLFPIKSRVRQCQPLLHTEMMELFASHLCLQIILDADFFDQVELRFQPVDMFFGVVEDVLE